MRNENDGCLPLLICSSGAVDLVEEVSRNYFNVVDGVCKDEVGIVSVGENSCVNVLLREELGQAISKPDSAIIGPPCFQPVAAQSMNRDDAACWRVESDQYMCAASAE